MWIDFDQNGSFDTSEEVVSGSTSSAGNLSYNFSIPSTALSGTTRMRVSMKWDADPTACESFSYGEVEDYTVNISEATSMAMPAKVKIDGSLGTEAAIFTSDLYNSRGLLLINMADQRPIHYKVYSMQGHVVGQGTFKGKTTLRNLKSGVYMLHIHDGTRSIQKKFAFK